MKPQRYVSNPSAKNACRPEVRINTERVPVSMQAALQSADVQEVAAALVEAVRNDPRNQPVATPVACPGAPYRRRKSTG